MFDLNVLKNCMWIDQCMFCFEFISVYFVDNLYYSDNIDVKKKMNEYLERIASCIHESISAIKISRHLLP